MTAICHPVTLTLLRDRIEPQLVPTAFIYDPDDPLAVRVVFNHGHPVLEIVWLLARSLLSDGLICRSGVGDFRVGPAEDDPDWLVLELCPSGWFQQFAVPFEAVVEFLFATFAVVPLGREWVTVEAEIDSLEVDW